MKTKTEVLDEFKDYLIIIEDVTKHIGLGLVQKVIDFGIDFGISGFIYYVDTRAFAMKYRDKIMGFLEEEAQQLGTEVVKMIGNYGILRGSPMEVVDSKDLHEYFSGGKPVGNDYKFDGMVLCREGLPIF